MRPARRVHPEYRELRKYVRAMGLPSQLEHPLLRSLLERYSSAMCTYFIQCGDRVKIGKSTDVHRRVSDMAVGMPYPPKILACVPDYVITEAHAHEKWADLRRNREWFEATPELLRWIRRDLKKRAEMVARLRARIVPYVERRLCDGHYRRPLQCLEPRYRTPARKPAPYSPTSPVSGSQQGVA